MSWSGMFKKFSSKSEVAGTYPTTNDGERKLGDQNEAVHAESKRLVDENERLVAQVMKGWQDEYDRGYENALENAIKAIDATGPRTGKKQITAMLQEQLDARTEEG